MADKERRKGKVSRREALFMGDRRATLGQSGDEAPARISAGVEDRRVGERRQTDRREPLTPKSGSGASKWSGRRISWDRRGFGKKDRRSQDIPQLRSGPDGTDARVAKRRAQAAPRGATGPAKLWGPHVDVERRARVGNIDSGRRARGTIVHGEGRTIMGGGDRREFDRRTERPERRSSAYGRRANVSAGRRAGDLVEAISSGRPVELDISKIKAVGKKLGRKAGTIGKLGLAGIALYDMVSKNKQ